MFTRSSGLLLPIFSLPSAHGIGELGNYAFEFARKLAESGMNWWQILPLSPTNNENSNSPYFSTSAFAGNPLLIDLYDLVEQQLLSSSEISGYFAAVEHTVHYDAVRAFKLPLLHKAYQRYQGSSARGAEFEQFCSQQAWWLDDFALFETLKVHFEQKPWHHWPEAFRDRQKKSLTQFAQKNQEPIDAQKFFQFLFFQQWQKLRNFCASIGITLVGDMPIYVSQDSADVWTNRPLFKLNKDGSPKAVSGVPPDYFSPTGQLWNNPVYDWNAIEADDFGWWKRRMKALFDRYDIVRIDHFRGLVQYWEVPAGESTAINGTWQDVPTRKLFDSLIAHCKDFPVIAEDLGTITEDVVQWMKHYDLPGMKVLQFAFGSTDPNHEYLPHTYEKNNVVYTGTHDNQTTLAWWLDDISEADMFRLNAYLGKATTGFSICGDLIRLAMASVASVAVIPVQDVLGLDHTARINNPARVENNWHWRLTTQQFNSIDWAFLAELVHRYGR